MNRVKVLWSVIARIFSGIWRRISDPVITLAWAALFACGMVLAAALLLVAIIGGIVAFGWLVVFLFLHLHPATATLAIMLIICLVNYWKKVWYCLCNVKRSFSRAGNRLRRIWDEENMKVIKVVERKLHHDYAERNAP